MFERPLDPEASLVAREMIVKLLALARAQGDEGRLAMALHAHGHACLLAGERDEAEKAFDESRELSARRGDKRGAAISTSMLGFAALEGGRLEDGIPRVIAALLEIEAGDPARAVVAGHLARLAKKFDRSRFEAAVRAATREKPELGTELIRGT